MKIYISGKITGYENAKQHFEKVEKSLLKNISWDEVINPMRINNVPQSWQNYTKEHIKILVDCDAIYNQRF